MLPSQSARIIASGASSTMARKLLSVTLLPLSFLPLYIGWARASRTSSGGLRSVTSTWKTPAPPGVSRSSLSSLPPNKVSSFGPGVGGYPLGSLSCIVASLLEDTHIGRRCSPCWMVTRLPSCQRVSSAPPRVLSDETRPSTLRRCHRRPKDAVQLSTESAHCCYVSRSRAAVASPKQRPCSSLDRVIKRARSYTVHAPPHKCVTVPQPSARLVKG